MVGRSKSSFSESRIVPSLRQSSENAIVALRAVATLIIGASAAFSISILTSGRLNSIAPEASTAFAWLIIVQSLCVTVAKIGFDSSIVALLSRCSDSERRYALPSWFGLYVFSIASVFALGTTFYFSSWELGACLFIASLLDTFAVLKIAELTAKRRIIKPLIANILRYPFLLGAIVATMTINTVSIRVFCILYVASALARFTYLLLREDKEFETVPLDVKVGLLAAQQILNFLVFRIDQLSARIIFDAEDSARRFMYFMSYSDMTLVGVAAVGGIVFPQLLQHFGGLAPVHARRDGLTAIIMLAICISLGFFLYASFFVGRPANWFEILCIIVAATVGSHVNFQAFLAYRSNNLRILVIAQAIGLFVAFAMLSMIKWFAYDFLLYTVCPTALSITSVYFWKNFRHQIFQSQF